jgi:hypothetical protein
MESTGMVKIAKEYEVEEYVESEGNGLEIVMVPGYSPPTDEGWFKLFGEGITNKMGVYGRWANPSEAIQPSEAGSEELVEGPEEDIWEPEDILDTEDILKPSSSASILEAPSSNSGYQFSSDEGAGAKSMDGFWDHRCASAQAVLTLEEGATCAWCNRSA